MGRDARISGAMVNDIIEGTPDGLRRRRDQRGPLHHPGTEMAVITHKADGGIIITASHNPKQWNALKLLNEHGEFLNDAEGSAYSRWPRRSRSTTPRLTHLVR